MHRGRRDGSLTQQQVYLFWWPLKCSNFWIFEISNLGSFESSSLHNIDKLLYAFEDFQWRRSWRIFFTYIDNVGGGCGGHLRSFRLLLKKIRRWRTWQWHLCTQTTSSTRNHQKMSVLTLSAADLHCCIRTARCDHSFNSGACDAVVKKKLSKTTSLLKFRAKLFYFKFTAAMNLKEALLNHSLKFATSLHLVCSIPMLTAL